MARIRKCGVCATCLKPHWKKRCLRPAMPVPAVPVPAVLPAPAMPPAQPAEAQAQKWVPADESDSDSDSDDLPAAEYEYYAGKWSNGDLWFARGALDARGRPDVEVHGQLCDCDVLVLETLGAARAVPGTRGREFLVEGLVTGTTRALREQMIELELSDVSNDADGRLRLGFVASFAAKDDNYDALDKMTDADKLTANGFFLGAVNLFCPPRASVVVLDAPTMVSTRTLLGPAGTGTHTCDYLTKKQIDEQTLTITAVSSSRTRAAWWLDSTPVGRGLKAAGRVRLVREDVRRVLTETAQYDAIFLDHCGTITSELSALDAAVAVLRRRGGVLAATYSVRGLGHDRTQDLFFGRVPRGCLDKCYFNFKYGKSMAFYMVYIPPV